MATVVHVTFSADDEATHFAAMLAGGHGVVVRPADPPADFDPMWTELWSEPQSVTNVEAGPDDDAEAAGEIPAGKFSVTVRVDDPDLNRAIWTGFVPGNLYGNPAARDMAAAEVRAGFVAAYIDLAKIREGRK